MQDSRKIKVGIGFATGRRSFRKILSTYVYNWRECGLNNLDKYTLSLIVAYDLNYSNTRTIHYTNIKPELYKTIDDACFIGKTRIRNEITNLIDRRVIDINEAMLLFGNEGYSVKRNLVLYFALKKKLDYLLFLDDDEYPLAVTKTRQTALWSGQHVLKCHLEHIGGADITNGHHCGYISPIPYIEFNDVMTEEVFKTFIEAISNDIINWDNIKKVMNNGGVTYADTEVLINNRAEEVPEINKAKFISGANLCINLTDPGRVKPFYNPPGARGEDTFLSTSLKEHKVIRVPCYTFHDGFSTYQHIMDGVLPINLRYIRANSDRIINRFYRACVGWVRYKPLLLYITQRENYKARMADIKLKLESSLPNVCAYFKRNEFMNILREFERYQFNVEKHYRQFNQVQQIWSKVINHLMENA
ncbi:MAG: hypothetical protein GX800_11195 [Clostridiaceae bacterium]|nr:hypothetical protein [Clostridiaceae bacterium]